MTTIRLSSKASMAVHAKWVELFSSRLKSFKTKVSSQFLWHNFSAGRHPAHAGPAAMSAYLLATAGLETFYVMAAERGRAIVERYTGEAPDFSGEDLIVFPLNYAWTMCFTHEQPQLGPYFAVPDADD